MAADRITDYYLAKTGNKLRSETAGRIRKKIHAGEENAIIKEKKRGKKNEVKKFGHNKEAGEIDKMIS